MGHPQLAHLCVKYTRRLIAREGGARVPKRKVSNAVHFRLFPANFLILVSGPCQAIPTQMPSISDPNQSLGVVWGKVRSADFVAVLCISVKARISSSRAVASTFVERLCCTNHLKAGVPLSRTDLSYGLCDVYAKSGVAVQE